MRSLLKVIDDMLKEIPESEKSLRSRLEKIADSYFFSAPEIHVLRWNQCAETLDDCIPVRSKDWHFKIAGIFSGEEYD